MKHLIKIFKISILIWFFGFTLIANNLLAQQYYINSYQYKDNYSTVFNGLINQNDTLVISGLSFDCLDSNTCYQGFYISKVDTLGHILMERVISAENDDIVAENTPILANTLDNGYFIVGELLSRGNSYLVKLNKNLEKEFAKEYIENGAEILSIRNRGILYLKGHYYILSIKQHSNFQRITHIIKIDSLGNIIWDKAFVKDGDSSVKFAISEDKTLMVFGQRSKLSSEKKLEIKQWCFFVDTSGSVVKEHESEWMINKYSGYFDILELENGYIISTSNYIYKPPLISIPRNQIILQKTDSEFVPQWTITYGDTTTINSIGNIISVGDETFIATGNYSPFPNNLPNSAITTLTMKFDKFGKIRWERLDSILYEPDFGCKNVTAESIILNSGSIITAGYTEVFQPQPSSLGFIVKLDSSGCLIPDCHLQVSTNDNDPKPIELKIFPNPVSDILTIQFLEKSDVNEIGTITILSVKGEALLIKDIKIINGEGKINLQKLPAGAYLIQIKIKKKNISYKFIKS